MDKKDEEEALQKRFLEAYLKMQRMKMHTIHPDLSSGEYCLLAAIKYLGEYSGDSAVHIATLVERQKVSPQAVSKMLRGLEQRQFIIRTVSKEDRRTSMVCLTDEGKCLVDTAETAANRFADYVIESMGQEKMEKLLTLLQELDKAVQKELQYFEDGLQGGDL